MAQISIENLTFCYPGKYDDIFSNVSFSIDSKWKLGLIGRNGRGKTTLFSLLVGKYPYEGNVHSPIGYEIFPYDIEDEHAQTLDILTSIAPEVARWQIERELSLLNLDAEILYRPFSTLSKGEQTKAQLAVMFSKENRFLLIDEPTNHLDALGRALVSAYLREKEGFIVVSHDRNFLDGCIDHVLALNRTNIEVLKGSFSTWWENKENRDHFEQLENEKLRRDIDRLTVSARQKKAWSNKVEATKIGQGAADRGYIGRQSARMMKRSLTIQRRIQDQIDEKEKLLKNVETVEELKISALTHHKKILISAKKLSLSYCEKPLFKPLDFDVIEGHRIALTGANGCGKSSVIKKIIGAEIFQTGTLEIATGLVISYVPQDASFLKGSLNDYASLSEISETLFKTILRKLDFRREQFDIPMDEYSEGQKKKVLLARSLCEKAHLYIWDEPLNYIDVFSRMQIEQVIMDSLPTMVIVEHDASFVGSVATDVLQIG